MRDGIFTVEAVEANLKREEIMKDRKTSFEAKKLHLMSFKEAKETRDDEENWMWIQK